VPRRIGSHSLGDPGRRPNASVAIEPSYRKEGLLARFGADIDVETNTREPSFNLQFILPCLAC